MNDKHISPAEREVMRVVWSTHPITSKDIFEVLKDKTEWKMATTKTLIGRLVKKGMLTTEAVGRRFEYSPAVTEEETIKESSNDLLNQICTKKVGETIYMMLEDSTVSVDDLKALERLIQKKKQTAPKVVACDCVIGQCTCE